MPDCIYCGCKAPIFAHFHAECKQKHEIGLTMAQKILCDAITFDSDLLEAANRAFSFCQSHFVRRTEISTCAADAWVQALDYYCRDNVLSDDEISRLHLAANTYKIEKERLEERCVPAKIADVKAKMAAKEKARTLAVSQETVLTSLQAGHLVKYPYPTPPLPFLFDANASLVWLFENVAYLEDKTRRETIRRYDGMGYHGLYTGESHSRTTEHTCLEPVDSGMVALTLKQIYFAGAKKSFRMPYAKIVSLKAYRDAVEIVKDGATAKRQVLQGLDGHFAHRLIRIIGAQSS